MEYYQYTFRCSKVPDARTMHSVSRYFLEDDNEQITVPFRVSLNGKLIIIRTTKLHDAEWTRRFHTKEGTEFDVTLIAMKSCESEVFQKDATVYIHGRVSYARHSKQTGQDKCPVNRQTILPAMRKDFIQKLQQDLGVQVSTLECTAIASEMCDEKVHIHNQFELELTGSVVDESTVSALCYTAVMRRKSYGLGNLEVMVI